MTLHQFTIFVAIAKHRNLTKASEELRITQPGVSQQMRLLADDYGAKLYNRTARGVELTDAGRRFLVAISPILEQVRKLKTAMSSTVSIPDPERLAVGGTRSVSTILLPALLNRFKKLNPHTEIDFRTNSGAEIEDLLLKHKVELAVTTRTPKSPRIVSERYRREKVILVVSQTHPLARAREVSLRDLERTPLLVQFAGGRDGPTIKRLNSLMAEKGIQVAIGMRFELPAALKSAIQQNMGIGLTNEDIVRSKLKRGAFKAIKVPGLNLEGQSYIVYLNDKVLSKAALEFLELLRSSRPLQPKPKSYLSDVQRFGSITPPVGERSEAPYVLDHQGR